MNSVNTGTKDFYGRPIHGEADNGEMPRQKNNVVHQDFVSAQNENDVFVGQGSDYANPFHHLRPEKSRSEVCSMYFKWLLRQDDIIWSVRNSLQGKRLVHDDDDHEMGHSHVDILWMIANGYHDTQLPMYPHVAFPGMCNHGIAAYVSKKFAASPDTATGKTGRGYAIRTNVQGGARLPSEKIGNEVLKFMAIARNECVRYRLLSMGLDVKNETDRQVIGKIVMNAPANVELPAIWRYFEEKQLVRNGGVGLGVVPGVIVCGSKHTQEGDDDYVLSRLELLERKLGFFSMHLGHMGITERIAEEFAVKRKLPLKRFPMEIEYGEDQARLFQNAILVWSSSHVLILNKGQKSLTQEQLHLYNMAQMAGLYVAVV